MGLNPDINIRAGDFISPNYQHSQNLQPQYVDRLKQQNTRTEQETFEQLLLKISHKHKFAAYIDDNCPRGISFFLYILSYVSDTGKECLEHFLCQVSLKATARTALKVLFHHGKLTFLSLS